MEYLFSVNAETLAHARENIEKQLNITMEAREGRHHGGDYCHFAGDGFQILLQENVDFDDIENEKNGLAEPQFPQSQWLLYIDGIAPLVSTVQRLADSSVYPLLRQRGGATS